MSYVTKLTGYGAVLLASLAVAMALLVSAPVEETEAFAGAAEVDAAVIAANGMQFITIDDPDLTMTPVGGQFAIFTINEASVVGPTFAASASKSLICIDGAACDLAGTPPTLSVSTGLATDSDIRVQVNGGGATGDVVVDMTLVDPGASDGFDGFIGTADIVSVGWTQVGGTASIQLFAGIGDTGIGPLPGTNSLTIPATPATNADQVVLAARLVTASGAPAATVAGLTANFTVGPAGTGVFSDSIGGNPVPGQPDNPVPLNAPAASVLVVPDDWRTAVAGFDGIPTAAGVEYPLGDATGPTTVTGGGIGPIPNDEFAGIDGCSGGNAPPGPGNQTCVAIIDGADLLAPGEVETAESGVGFGELGTTGLGTSSVIVVFEGSNVPGTANITASFGGTVSNPIVVTMFGPARNAELSVSGAATCLVVGGCSNRVTNGNATAAPVVVTSVDILVTDALDFPVSGHTPQLRVDPATTAPLAVLGAIGMTGPTGVTTVTIAVPAGGVAEGIQTLQTALAGASFTTTASLDITFVGPIFDFQFVSQTPEGTVDALSTFTVVFHCSTAGGLDCLVGAPLGVTAATGAGLLVAPFPVIGAGGNITFNVLAEDQKGNAIAVFVSNPTGAITEQHNVTITPEVAGGGGTGGGAGTFAPPVAPAGQTFTLFSGGSVEALLVALTASGATSATATLPDGSTVTAIVTTLTFVNADFNTAFPTIPAGTIFAVKSLN